jgi:hypothetical protein
MDSILTKIYTDAKVPDIGGLMLTVGPTSPYVFFVAAGPPYSQQLGIDVAASVKPKKVGAVLCTEFAACATVGEVLQKRADALGVGWGGVVQVGKADTNYTAACLTMQEKGIDYIQLLIPSDVGLRLINDCTKQGYVPAYYEPYSAAVDGVAMKEMSKTGVTFTGFTPGFPWWTNDPNAQQFRRVMEKYSDKHKVPENPTQTVAWASLELFRKAMANASDTPTKEEVLAAMNAIQGDDLGGLLPVAVSYPPGATPEPLKCAWTFTVKAGEFSGGDRICLAG